MEESPEQTSQKVRKNKSEEQDQFRKMVKQRPCNVCEAPSTGYHFGVMSCEACKSFFRRSVKRKGALMCIRNGDCVITFGVVKGTPCPACRMKRCLEVGMSLNSVRKGRYTLEKRAAAIKELRQFDKDHQGSFVHQQTSSPGDLHSPPSNAISECIVRKDTAAGLVTTSRNSFEQNIKSPSNTSSISTASYSPDEMLHSQSDPDLHQRIVSSRPVDERGYQSDISRTTNSTHSNASDSLRPQKNNKQSERMIPKKRKSIVPSALDELHTLLNRLENDSALLSETQHLDTQNGTQGLKALFKTTENPSDLLDFALAKADEENLDKLTEQAIEAYDRRNFVTKGFLAKIPEYQYTFLKEQEENERLFGSYRPLNPEEHRDLYEVTGVDVDGRQDLIKSFIETVLVPQFLEYAAYITNLPGIKSLPVEDQHSLLKLSKFRLHTCIRFPTVNVKAKLVVHQVKPNHDGQAIPPQDHQVHDKNTHDFIFNYSQELLDAGLAVVKKLQNMALTDHEYALVSASAIVRPAPCVTHEGQVKCEMIQQRMFKALEKLLHKRMKNSDVYKKMGEIHELIEMFEASENIFLIEWDDFINRNRNIKFPRIIWDMVARPIPDDANF